MKVVVENKISGTRMRQIALCAGMSQGTVHYYFPSKAELLLALLDRMQKTYNAERQSGLENDEIKPVDKLRLFFQQKQRLLLEKPHLSAVTFDFSSQGIIDPAIQQRIQRNYDRWRQDI